MKHILTILLLLCSLSVFSQNASFTRNRKPKTTSPAAKPQSQPKQTQAQQRQQSSISAPNGYENGHAYVDLGLSVKWATMNVGAKSPTGCGDYFAWGETYTKSDYNWSTYFDTDDGGRSFIKYSSGKKTTLELSDDAAHVNWGGSWRMPTKAELDELQEKCTWVWTTQNRVKGYKVTSKRNGNSIFLPAAGFRSEGSVNRVGVLSDYWSSTFGAGELNKACYLYFYSGGVGPVRNFRDYGFTVRAVCK